VELGLLGPLQLVNQRGDVIALSGAKVRTLLCRLALDAGHVVPTDQLLEDLWGGAQPENPSNALQGVVSRLRRALGPPDLILNRGSGYALDLADEDLDTAAFHRLAALGRSAQAGGHPEEALALFDRALSLWRGPPMVDFAYEDFAQSAIGQLLEAKATVLEDRADALLCLGRHAEVVSDLEVLIDEYPLREGLRAQLMVALYRSGRQAEALRAFQAARAVLGEELGIDPGADLRRLEAAILAQDPSLDPPALRVSEVPPILGRRTNIGAPITPLVGRQVELQDVGGLILSERLVTLTGPGGVGKTRLAVEVARARAPELSAGAWLAELAPITDPAAVAPTIVTALDAADTATPPLQRLTEYLADKEILLVIDNCEHVIAEAARVVLELLGSCPKLTILATSREPLGVPGERSWSTPPLNLADAVALFNMRATAADRHFVLDRKAEPVVMDVCQRLDGMPLAVELAAARVPAFDIEAIAQRLSDRFRLLTGGARTALARHQTLRAVVDWSYDLLFDDERRLFDRLSVFAGSSTLAAAESVCAGGDLPASEVADTLSRLVSKSLVLAERDGSGTRYRLLQTLADYGREHLLASGELSELRRLHAGHYLGLARLSDAAWQGADQLAWMAAVQADLDNLRAAMTWAVERQDSEQALFLAGNLGWFWWMAGAATEGAHWLCTALAVPGEPDPNTRARALAWTAFLAVVSGDTETYGKLKDQLYRTMELADLNLSATLVLLLAVMENVRGDRTTASRLFQKAEQSFRLLSGPWPAAALAFSVGEQSQLNGDPSTAERHLSEAAAKLTAVGAMIMAVIGLRLVGDLRQDAGDESGAADAFKRARAITTEFGFIPFSAGLSARLGMLATFQGDFDEAEVHLAAAIRLSDQRSLPWYRALALSGLAALRRRQSRLAEAKAAALEALELFDATNMPDGTVMALTELGFIEEQAGDPAEAELRHRAALSEAERSGNRRSMAVASEGLAGAAAASGDGYKAAQWLSQAQALRASSGGPATSAQRFDLERIESAIARIHSQDAPPTGPMLKSRQQDRRTSRTGPTQNRIVGPSTEPNCR
jgi:predicted ATPase/DNA-binding SARP family transcriptional activator